MRPYRVLGYLMDIEKLNLVSSFMEGWKVDNRNEYRPRLINGNGKAIIIQAINGQKWLLTGESPIDGSGRHYGNSKIARHQIRVSHKRDPKLIANDISRRLIPLYSELVEEAKKDKIKSDENIHWCDQIEGLLSQLLRGQPPRHTRKKKEPYRIVSFGSIKAASGIGEARINTSTIGHGKIDLTIQNLKPDLAIKLLHYYKNEIVNVEK